MLDIRLVHGRVGICFGRGHRTGGMRIGTRNEDGRRGQEPVSISRETEPLVKKTRNGAAACGIDLAPHLHATKRRGVWLPLENGHVIEQVRENGAKQSGNAQLAHGIRLAGKVDGNLHRGGRAHHAFGMHAGQLGEVLVHEAIARLGNDGEVGRVVLGIVSQRHELVVIGLENLLHAQREVIVLVLDISQREHGRDGELELRRGLDGDVGIEAEQRQDVTLLVAHDLGIIGAQLLEDITHAQTTVLLDVGHAVTVFVEHELLDLDADIAHVTALAPRFEVLDD